MDENNSGKSESVSRLGSSPSDEESKPLPAHPATTATAATAAANEDAEATSAPIKVTDNFNYSCDGYEIHEETPDRVSGGVGTLEAAASDSAPSPATAPPSYAALNPDFDLAQLPVERLFNWIEKEFATIESRTMNPRQYNFTTSYAFPTKNRYVNVMANEETLFPPLHSPRAVRSSAAAATASAATAPSTASLRSTGQRILDTLRGSPTTTIPTNNSSSGASSTGSKVGGDVNGFKANSLTASGKNVPLYFNGNVLDMGVDPVFVASQAPVLDCMEDFLNAIYNYQIPLILMLTETEEGGFAKADRYWPADKASGLAGEVFGNMAVYKDLNNPYEMDTKHELIWRPFFIRPCNAPKEKAHRVMMVQYVGWPDRGVPDSTESFEELLRIINDQTWMASSASSPKAAEGGRDGSGNSGSSGDTNSNSNSSGDSGARRTPSVLVHCSAGIGRTGTLIGAYTAIKLMEAGKLNRDSLRSILTSMRKARFGMVQRVEQYMFLYLIVLQHMGVDTTQFVSRMQPRADMYNYRWMEARQAAMAAARARQQQQ